MVTAIRRLDDERIEAMFDKGLNPDGKAAQTLEEMAKGGDVFLIRDHEQRIQGVDCSEKDYVRFLQAIEAPKTTIENFRKSLDDSKRAIRERQRR